MHQMLLFLNINKKQRPENLNKTKNYLEKKYDGWNSTLNTQLVRQQQRKIPKDYNII